MSSFYTLTVKDVHNTIRDAVVLTLEPNEKDLNAFDFTQGQYLTFRHNFDGEEVRRSYSICSGKDDGLLKVGIKRVEGGCFSNWANDTIEVGDKIEVMPPMGKFYAPLEADKQKQYLGFAGGSGITPVLSIIKTTLNREPLSQFTLIYANRSVNTIMFREELEDIKNQYMDRFNVIHILEEDAQDIDLFTGRIDEKKCERLFQNWVDIEAVDMAFICGPEPMMLGIAKALKEHGLSDDQIKYELFASSQPGRVARKVNSEGKSSSTQMPEATIKLDGTKLTFQMDRQGETILDAALANNLDAPYSCKAGICSTCRAKIIEGEAEMMANHALEDYEVRQGYVLTCQSHPVSKKIIVDYDQ